MKNSPVADEIELKITNMQPSVMCLCAEMAGHHQRGEVPAETSPPEHNRVSGLLPEGAHSMGTFHILPLCPTRCPQFDYTGT